MTFGKSRGLPRPTDPHPIIKAYFRNGSHWLHLMADAARAFLDPDDVDRQNNCRLVRKGFRSSDTFIISVPGDLAPYFGLLRYPTINACFDGPEARIQHLREYARKHYKEDDGLIIRYYLNSREKQDLDLDCEAQFATVFPLRTSSKRKRGSTDSERYIHCRWLTDLEDEDLPKDAAQEHCIPRKPGLFIVQEKEFHYRNTSDSWDTYSLSYGDHQSAGIFRKANIGEQALFYRPDDILETEDLLYILEHNLLDLASLLLYIETNLVELFSVPSFWPSSSANIPNQHLRQSSPYDDWKQIFNGDELCNPIPCTLEALSVMSIIFKFTPRCNNCRRGVS